MTDEGSDIPREGLGGTAAQAGSGVDPERGMERTESGEKRSEACVCLIIISNKGELIARLMCHVDGINCNKQSEVVEKY